MLRVIIYKTLHVLTIYGLGGMVILVLLKESRERHFF